MTRLYRNFGKRAVDLAAAALGLVLLSPLFLVTAVLIKFTSRGPILYCQERIGRYGRPFTFIKFRTMIVDAEKQGAGVLCLKDDPRITPIGKFLRKFSLDELPQLFNVLRGEMSLIGPRPGLQYQVTEYTPFQKRRLEVLPGITGWAQVNGRNSISWDERIRYDVEYIDRLSLLLDARILLKTIKTVLCRENMIAAKDYFKEKPHEQSG